jgi:hypothetical protein
MWCTIELNLGIFGGCVTAIRPFIRQYFPRLLGVSSGEYDSTSRKYDHQLSPLPSQRPDFSGREHQYSATLTTLREASDNDSEEHILSKLSSGQDKDADGPGGIVHMVEFDVKKTSRLEQ